MNAIDFEKENGRFLLSTFRELETAVTQLEVINHDAINSSATLEGSIILLQETMEGIISRVGNKILGYDAENYAVAIDLIND